MSISTGLEFQVVEVKEELSARCAERRVILKNKRGRETKMEWLRARRKWKAQVKAGVGLCKNSHDKNHSKSLHLFGRLFVRWCRRTSSIRTSWKSHGSIIHPILERSKYGKKKSYQSGGGAGPSQFSEQQKQVRFQQTHNQSLRQLFLTVSWDLLA